MENEFTGITGSSGFLGRHLVFHLGNPQYVVKIGRSDSGFEPVNQDLAKLYLCHGSISSGGDQLSQDSLFQGNVKLTQQICDTFSKATLVFASTASIYGFQERTIIESDACFPPNAYAISKLWGEELIRQTGSNSIVRFGSLYGIGMRENTIIPNYVNQALTVGEISVWGRGERKQNYLNIEDAAALMVAASAGSFKKIFLGVDLMEYSNLDLAEIIARQTGAKINFLGQDASKSVSYNNAFTRDTLNWKPAISFEAGLSQYIEWKKRQLL